MTQGTNRRAFLGSALAAAGLSPIAQAIGNNAPGALPTLALPAPGVAKLNANENPVGPSPAARAAIAESATYGAYYVSQNVKRLKAMIAERHGLTTEHVALSSGSSGVLTYLAVAASREGHILGPDLFWDTTCKAAERQGAVIERLPKSPDLTIDLDAMLAQVNGQTALVHVTNPNNPTGLMLDAERLRKFCRAATKKTMVLVDEAYNELTDDPDGNTMVDLVREGHAVAVARTFSKIFGLAGMRVGYIMSTPEIIEKLSVFSLGDYALNQAGVAAAIASYTDEAFMAESKQKIFEARGMVEAGLKANGLEYLPSQTNFVFANLGSLDAEKFRAEMAARSVLIRGIYRDYTHHSRVSMGNLPDVAQYVENIPKVLDALSA
ncbi:MAG: histidinol-phosphate transaminase [Pseudomonadota bacterium]